MYRRLEDFLAVYEEMSEGTARLLSELTDESLAQEICPGHRKLGEIAWHTAVSVAEMIGRTGLQMRAIDPEARPPARAAEIAAGYRAVTAELLELVRAGWTDETLAETDDMYGQRWPRALTLAVLVRHEAHHRGQMTVLMRQAGLRVPGLMGPAREDWAQFGMPLPAY